MVIRSKESETRLPLYNDVIDSVRRSKDQGAFADIDPTLIGLIEQSVPARLDARNNVVTDASYDPRNGPAILVMHPREKGMIHTNQLGSQLISRMDAESDDYIRPSFRGDGNYLMQPSTAAAVIVKRYVTIDEAAGTKTERKLPILLAISSMCFKQHDDAILVGHELTHWQDDLQDPTMTKAERVKSEKTAYHNSQTIIENVGYDSLVRNPEALAADIDGLSTSAAVKVLRAGSKTLGKTGTSRGLYQYTAYAGALSLVYGTEDISGDMTADEVYSYRQMGLA